MSPVQALQGDSVVLAITVGTPVNPALVKENFTWTYGSARVPQNANNVEENGSLRLTSVQPLQTGVYTCTAVNTGGNGSATVRLDVLGEEVFWCWDRILLLPSASHNPTIERQRMSHSVGGLSTDPGTKSRSWERLVGWGKTCVIFGACAWSSVLISCKYSRRQRLLMILFPGAWRCEPGVTI